MDGNILKERDEVLPSDHSQSCPKCGSSFAVLVVLR